MKIIDINEGKTNNYLIHGIAVIVVSFVFFGIASTSLLLFFLGAALFIFSILLFTATNGLQINIQTKKYRRYGRIGTVSFGEWKLLISPAKVVLKMAAQNAYMGTAPMLGRVASLDTKTLTYDIYVMDQEENEQLLYDFLDYKVAKVALKEIGENYAIPMVNLVAEKLAENRRKRG